MTWLRPGAVFAKPHWGWGLLLAACSDAGSGASSQGEDSGLAFDAGGQAADASVRVAFDAGFDAAAPEEPSPTEWAALCTDHAELYCRRYAECASLALRRAFEDVETCERLTAEACTTEARLGYPLADIEGCSRALAEGSCSDVLYDPAGACAHEVGPSKADEVCFANGECASGRCAFADSPCGHCEALLSEGAACAEAEGTCQAPDFTCDAEADACVRIARLELGERCGAPTEACRPGLFCSSEGSCLTPLGEGDDCSEEPEGCDARRQLVCSATGECEYVVLRSLGEPCGEEAGRSPGCSEQAYCDPEQRRCVPRAAPFEACALEPASGSTCLPNLSCVQGICVSHLDFCEL